MDTQTNSTSLPAVSIGGVEITTDTEGRFNLNALHRASGAEKKDGPTYWLALEGTGRLIAELENQTTEISVVSKEGRSGGTFAHELLAISYAGWISPSFQLKVNQAFLDVRSGKASTHPVSIDDLIRNPEHLLAITQGYALQISDMRRDMTVMQTDVDTLNRITGADDMFGVRETAKLVQMPQNRFVEWLKRNKWAYRQTGSNKLLAYADKEKAGLCRNVVRPYTKDDGSEGVGETLKFFPKGVVAVAKKLNIEISEANLPAMAGMITTSKNI